MTTTTPKTPPTTPPTIAISTGDPGGIGPEISLRAVSELLGRGRFLLFGDREALLALRERWAPSLLDAPEDRVCFLDTGRWEPGATAHAPTPEGGRAQLFALTAAIEALKTGEAGALCTAPTSKEAITLAGTPFVGQTEHLARAFGLPDEAVTMLFLGPRLKTALVTRHLAIRDVPGAITAEGVAKATLHLGEAICCLGIRSPSGGPPRIVVASLNPHAGESGLFGDEEPRILEPGVEAAKGRGPFLSGEAELLGLRPAETAFRRAARGEVEGVVGIFHDQATIASKLLDWGDAVNVTWGLPSVRTSPDHGVAYDAAASGEADPQGMISALSLAIELASKPASSETSSPERES